MRDCIYNFLSKCDFIDENLYLEVLGFIDDILLLFLGRNWENLVSEIINLRIELLQLLCLGKII